MVRIILAAFAGTIICFIWQMMAWMVIPLHGPTVYQLPDEDRVRDALVAQDLKTGVTRSLLSLNDTRPVPLPPSSTIAPALNQCRRPRSPFVLPPTWHRPSLFPCY